MNLPQPVVAAGLVGTAIRGWLAAVLPFLKNGQGRWRWGWGPARSRGIQPEADGRVAIRPVDLQELLHKTVQDAFRSDAVQKTVKDAVRTAMVGLSQTQMNSSSDGQGERQFSAASAAPAAPAVSNPPAQVRQLSSTEQFSLQARPSSVISVARVRVSQLVLLIHVKFLALPQLIRAPHQTPIRTPYKRSSTHSILMYLIVN